MHAVVVGIGCYDDLVVAQAIEAVLDIECGLQEIELLVLVHHFLRELVAVQGLASKTEDGLSIYVAALRDAAAGRVTLSDEDAALLLEFALGVGQMYSAVAELAVVQACLLRHLARLLGHAGHFLAQLLAFGHLLEDDVGHFRILV